MEQLKKNPLRWLAVAVFACSMPTEQFGTDGTEPASLTSVNKSWCIIIISGNYHQIGTNRKHLTNLGQQKAPQFLGGLDCAGLLGGNGERGA
jgi:hypothetical protein